MTSFELWLCGFSELKNVFEFAFFMQALWLYALVVTAFTFPMCSICKWLYLWYSLDNWTPKQAISHESECYVSLRGDLYDQVPRLWNVKILYTSVIINTRSEGYQVLLTMANHNLSRVYNITVARWPHGLCARLRSEWSGFEPWPGTLCCVLRQDTLLSRCLSPPRCINGYRQT